MPQITLTLTHDDGSRTERTFPLHGDLDHLNDIDEAVERFKNQALPQIEQELLTQAHARAVAREKKNGD